MERLFTFHGGMWSHGVARLLVRAIPLLEARAVLPFIHHLSGLEQTRLYVTALDDAFTAVTPTILEDHTIHSGYENWALSVVDPNGELSRVNMRFAREVIAQATNMTPYDPDPPYDVHEKGETVGEALAREVLYLPEYAVLLGYGSPRHRESGQFAIAIVASSAEALRQRVSAKAYANWENRGRPHGDALTDWLGARNELGIPSEVNV
jgi:hypothetical protein